MCMIKNVFQRVFYEQWNKSFIFKIKFFWSLSSFSISSPKNLIVNVKIADDIKNDDKDHNNFILKKFYMKLPFSNSSIDL